MLFHRAFHHYTGGHGKVWDYFGHVRAHPGWEVGIHLTPDSVAEGNPWLAEGQAAQHDWRPAQADTLFLAGMDWDAYPWDRADKPVINLIQGVRHADPALLLHSYLSRPAIRICVGAPVAAAICASGKVRGPVLTIQAGVHVPEPPSHPGSGVFIAGYKQPELARALSLQLQAAGARVDLAVDWLPRTVFLERMAATEIVVALPLAEEGFFLPALEAMAQGRATIVPDCIGNRAYADPESNVLSPPMSVPALAEAVSRLRHDACLRARIAANGLATARRFGLARERQAVHEMLDNLDALWTQAWAATSH